MASYRSFGGLDDQPLIDGDVGFVGMNQREQPNQLKAGELVLSKNGRIEGYWQPRRGIELKSGALANSANPLTLPFIVLNTQLVISTASRSSDLVTVNFASPHGIPSGNFPAYITLGTPSISTQPIAGISPGSYLFSYVDADSLRFSSVGSDSSSLAIDATYGRIGTSLDDTSVSNIYGSCVFSDPSTNSEESVIIATNNEAKKVLLSDYSVSSLSYPNGNVITENVEMLQAFDRIYLFRNGERAFEWFPNGRAIDSASQSTTTVTMQVKDHGLSIGDTVVVSGLTGGIPANGTFEVSSVTDKDTFVFSNTQLSITGTLSPDVAGVYEIGEGTINGRSYWKSPTLVRTGPAVISGSNPQFSGAGTLIYYDGFGTRWIIKNRTTTDSSASFSRSWISNTTSGTDIFAATGWAPVAPATGTPTLSPVSQTQTFGVASGVLNAGFTFVPAGAYSRPQYFNIAGNAYGVINGLVRLTVVGNTTIVAGDRVTIRDTTVPLLESIVGQNFVVTEATATDIYFNAPVPNVTYASGSGAQFIEFGSRYSLGLGFTHMPAPEWAVYFQRRLWTPYFYEPEGTGIAPTYADREVRDEIAASDILDPNTFDSVESQFRVTAGIADYLVGLHPFYEDKMIVFNRNSVHLINGTKGTLSDTTLRELTREIGCLSRRSIASKGNAIFFLSDDGVYGLEFLDEYNLRGVEEPLSKPIQPIIDRINKGLAANSVAIYFDNRYYLAVPLDSEIDANDATGNNAILIFNIKNKAWESIDTFGNDDFNVTNFIRGQAEERNELYLVNENGGLHLTDSLGEAKDIYSTNVVGNSIANGIDYELKSRGYAMSDYGRKKYKKATIQMQSDRDNASDVDFYFSTEDPDTANTMVTDISTLLDPSIGLPGQLEPSETADFSFRLGNPRGVYGVLTIKCKIVGSTAIGRPRVSSVAVEATKTSRQTITQY